MANATVHLEGLRGVMGTLRQLPPELVSVRGGPVRDALRRAVVIIQKQAQANVRAMVLEPNKDGLLSFSTGALEKSIVVSRRKMNVKGERFSLGPFKKIKYANIRQNRGMRTSRRSGEEGIKLRRFGLEYETAVGPTFYAWFLEFGTEKMRPHPFMRPAYELKKNEALQTFVNEMPKAIGRALKKLIKKNRVKV